MRRRRGGDRRRPRRKWRESELRLSIKVIVKDAQTQWEHNEVTMRTSRGQWRDTLERRTDKMAAFVGGPQITFCTSFVCSPEQALSKPWASPEQSPFGPWKDIKEEQRQGQVIRAWRGHQGPCQLAYRKALWQACPISYYSIYCKWMSYGGLLRTYVKALALSHYLLIIYDE